MPLTCPFCARETPAEALVCGSCARDITIPASLIAERDDLRQKRDQVRDELARTRAELERRRHRGKMRTP